VAGGTRTTDASEAIKNLALFSSGDGGGSWSLSPTDLTDTGAPAANDVAAALGSDGTLFETWNSSTCVCVHRGTSAATPNVNLQQGLGDFGWDPGIALDKASGQMVVAWFSDATGHTGVYTEAVDQSTGAATGTPRVMPGTSTLADGPFNGRTQIAARAGGGLFVAYTGGYPSHDRLLVWRVGAGVLSLQLKFASQINSVGIASDPGGRLWIYWAGSTPAGRLVVYARRSNPKVSRWGAIVAVAPPAGATDSWHLVGNAQRTRLDLLGSFSNDTNAPVATSHTQVLPGLSLATAPTHLRVDSKQPQQVIATVTDAGTPVPGAVVHAGSETATTNAHGKATFKLGPFTRPTRLVVRATRPGYVGSALTVTVR
jgi:hypothetical protein